VNRSSHNRLQFQQLFNIQKQLDLNLISLTSDRQEPLFYFHHKLSPSSISSILYIHYQFIMKFTSPLNLLMVASVAEVFTIVHAASCYNGPSFQYDENTYNNAWAVRSTICGSDSASCQTVGTSVICEFQSGNLYGGYRADSIDQAKSACYVSIHTSCFSCNELCWLTQQDAFENIINQCIYSNQPGGFYTYNNMVYSIQPIEVGKNYVQN
jgi:hypothetical protein